MPDIRKLGDLIADKVADDSCRTIILVDTVRGIQVYQTFVQDPDAEIAPVDMDVVAAEFDKTLEVSRTTLNRRTDETKFPIIKAIGDAPVTIVVKFASGEYTVADVTTKSINQHLGFSE